MIDIAIPLAERPLPAALERPEGATGLVVFVHGSGVDRHDARSVRVARALNEAGLATLLPELLEPRQAGERHDAFDCDLQCTRLLHALDWLDDAPWSKRLRVGFFATGIGTSLALMAAAKRPERAAAVVCRGGRPDSALFWLPQVKAPTLLLVEADGWPYRSVYDALTAPKELVVVPGASALFGEPEAIEAVASHAQRWFSRYLTREGSAPDGTPR
jgi:putative phosphoribosyl transferase